MGKVKKLKPRLRILFGEATALGPGKVELIEAIEQAGSISGAAKNMGMSYRRAWNLADSINHDFKEAIIETNSGGKGGGGATISPIGREILTRYREIEDKAMASVTKEVEFFGRYLDQKSKPKNLNPKSKTSKRDRQIRT